LSRRFGILDVSQLHGLLQGYFSFYLYKEDVRQGSGPPVDSIIYQIRNKCVSDSFYSPYEVFEKECFNVAFLSKRNSNPQSLIRFSATTNRKYVESESREQEGRRDLIIIYAFQSLNFQLAIISDHLPLTSLGIDNQTRVHFPHAYKPVPCALRQT
jgi:hypothetical protein